MAFNPGRGTNISHWLSQCSSRGAERRAWFIREDVSRIADMNFDHIRIPVDEEQMWKENGIQENEAFDLLNESIYWCQRENLKAIVDLHILRTHYFNDIDEPKLFTDPEEKDRLASLWGSISCNIGSWSEDLIAYEILNEPVARDNASWNEVSNFVFDKIRGVEPKRTVIIGSNRWNSVDTFDELEVPDDKNIILTFHYYNPMLLTHYRAPWWEGGAYCGQVNYPGKPVPKEDLERVEGPFREKLLGWNKYCDRNVMVEHISKPLSLKEKTVTSEMNLGILHCHYFISEVKSGLWVLALCHLWGRVYKTQQKRNPAIPACVLFLVTCLYPNTKV
ncbi:MAG: glycoside hydrolase family 5 protein [Fibrobacter sp.]|nr:glycoside hydrolase family 5 protein [Fibrobacter sp.]